MGDKEVRTLLVDQKLKELISPLQDSEYRQLEENLITDGCRDPIITWNGVIIDGHNRYELCTKHSIPFAIVEKEFSCEEEAIAWICANQLGRRNLSNATRKYLIGLQYESEKVAHVRKNPKGINQYSDGNEQRGVRVKSGRNKRTVDQIAEDNNLSHGSVERYAQYAKAVERIGEKVPEVVPVILSGRYKISHDNILALSEKPEGEIRDCCERLKKIQDPCVGYAETRQELPVYTSPKLASEVIAAKSTSVKDMPAFDPDAEVVGLTLTIPSWIGSIERIDKASKLDTASYHAKEQLADVLKQLKKHINRVLLVIGE